MSMAFRFCSLLIVAFAWMIPAGNTAPLTAGNLVISTDDVLYEYTPAGVFVQSFAIPYATGPYPVLEYARDIAISVDKTEIHVYNGTYEPYVSTLDLSTSLWSHQTFAGWSTANNVSYGGIGVGGGANVYVTDMATDAPGAPRGIIRFDSGGGMTPFATGIDPYDLNVGHDELLYALADDTVYVYAQDTLALQNTIDLDSTLGQDDYRAVAANATGQMFVVTWSGFLHKTNSSGASLLSVDLYVVGNPVVRQLVDVDVSNTGTVVVGDGAGGVTVTDENFTNPATFTIGVDDIFVAVQIGTPVPVSLSGFSTD